MSFSITPTLGSNISPSFASWTLPSGVTNVSGVLNWDGTESVYASCYTNADILNVGSWYQTSFDMTSYTSGIVQLLPNITGSVGYSAQANTNIQIGRVSTVRKIHLQATNPVLQGSTTNVQCKQLTLASLFGQVETYTSFGIASVLISCLVGTQAGLVLKLDSATTPLNFILVYIDRVNTASGIHLKVDKCINGVYSNLVNISGGYIEGQKLQVVYNGSNNYEVTYGSNIQSFTVSDSGIINNSIAGAFSTHYSNTFNSLMIREDIPTGTDIIDISKWTTNDTNISISNGTISFNGNEGAGNYATQTIGNGWFKLNADITGTSGQMQLFTGAGNGTYTTKLNYIGAKLCTPYNVEIKGDTVQGSDIVTNIINTMGIREGDLIGGTGLESNTEVLHVLDSNRIQLDQPAASK